MRTDEVRIEMLEKEKTALTDKITAANREIMGLRQRLRGYEQAALELRKTVDMLLTAAALQYGTQAEAGAREFTLRDVGPRLLEEWRVSLRVEKDSGEYKISVDRPG